MESQAEADMGALLETHVLHPGVAPAAVAGARGPGLEHELVVARGSAARDSIFDLASLTKTLFALTVADLAASGELSWDSSLALLLPGVARTPAGSRTIEQLLCHRAGLVAHVELFRAAYGGEPFRRDRALLRLAHSVRADTEGAALPPESWPRPVYSDLGYQLLGWALECRFEVALDSLMSAALRRALGEKVAHELGSAREWRARTKAFEGRVVPTEFVLERGGLIRGAVHDDNAWVMSGYGSSGHAGQFGTAEGVLGLGQCLLTALTEWLELSPSERALHPYDRLFRRRPGGSLRLGLDGVSRAGSSAGTRASPETVGHLGFTGTSFWVDPEQRAVTLLLTNRVCPARTNLGIRAARPVVHDELWQKASGAR